ncbi:hypothetical protein ASG75_11455 [Rhodanobacter sp. Soil772]|nr:hypothetical protein ASG75_11455 [Rhodanobacter sp. Soil772]
MAATSALRIMGFRSFGFLAQAQNGKSLMHYMFLVLQSAQIQAFCISGSVRRTSSFLLVAPNISFKADGFAAA